MSDKPQEESGLDSELEEILDQVHPFVIEFVKHLRPKEPKGFEFLNEDELRDLYVVMLEIKDDPQFVHVCQSLSAFGAACYFDLDSKDLAEQIYEVLNDEAVLESLQKKISTVDPEEMAEVAQDFNRFSGIDELKKAPKVGAKRPEGALTLDNLSFPKKM